MYGDSTPVARQRPTPAASTDSVCQPYQIVFSVFSSFSCAAAGVARKNSARAIARRRTSAILARYVLDDLLEEAGLREEKIHVMTADDGDELRAGDRVCDLLTHRVRNDLVGIAVRDERGSFDRRRLRDRVEPMA